MLRIKNAKLRNKEGYYQILIENAQIQSIVANEDPIDWKHETIDAGFNLTVPPFCEPHIHLDTTQTAGQPRWNQSGTLFEGIERWAERKAQLNHEDVKSRAKKTLKWQIAQGIQYVRSHVDVSDPNLVALQAMLELKHEMKQWVDLQIVAFPQEGILSFPNGKALLDESIKLGADVVGAIPHFEFTREYGVESLHYAFDVAMKYNRLVDVHCDEIDDEQSRFIETLATLALEHKIGSKVTASHTTAMGSYNSAYTSRLFRLLKLSGISFVSNPLVNIHLQGRFDDYPKRRGLTRVKELIDAGINLCFGHDDVFDPWYPLGTANMLQVLHMGLHASQLMGYEQIDQSLDLISTNSAKALNVESHYGVDVGKPANLIILAADSGFDAVRRQVPVLYSIRQGKVIAKTEPAQSQIYLQESEAINFR
ncbi:cytosine deaminase [Vibrio sp. S4M6]|uniref:cytosine deaminase n=1 Tax=Vibrio sinus TaxID=2946865 RepID=UPI002029B41C|nr:cytosine deaminase [Vibrio sinus]MCL9780589.1 cytosine deaminase [Vibrio sinus]